MRDNRRSVRCEYLATVVVGKYQTNSYKYDILLRNMIPIRLNKWTSPELPPQLAKLGSDEVIIIELQGTLEVESNCESDRDGQIAAKLRVDDTVDFFKPIFFLVKTR
jgi:hypothetical protein